VAVLIGNICIDWCASASKCFSDSLIFAHVSVLVQIVLVVRELLSSLDFSDRMVWTPLFWDRISNCTHLFQPEPNWSRHRIFTFVSLLCGNLYRSKCCTHTCTVRRSYI